MVIYINHKYLPWICGGLLLAYSILLLTGNGYACDDTNLLAVIDRNVFGEAHLYKRVRLIRKALPAHYLP